MATTEFEGANLVRLKGRALTNKERESQERTASEELSHLRQRSTYLIRNNGHAASAQTNTVAAWIGNGIRGKWNHKKLQAYWKAFTDKPTVDGKGNFYEFQRLLGNEVFSKGEIFIRKRILTEYTDREIPFYLEPITAEYLETQTYLQISNDRPIEKDANGRVTAYNFYNRRLQSDIWTSIDLTGVRIPADEIIHVCYRHSTTDDRGIPFLAPVIVPLLDIEDLTEASIIRHQAGAAIAWAVKKHSGMKINPLGQPSTEQVSVGGVNGLPASQEQRIISSVEAGSVHYLNEDEDLIPFDPPDIGSNLPIIIKMLLRKAALGAGLTYELVSGDLADVNYSSLRSGMLNFRIRIEQLQRLLIIGMGLQPIADQFQRFCSAWTGRDFSKATISWYLPRKEGIDPYKDMQATVLGLEYGTENLKRLIEAQGLDWDEFLQEREESKQRVPESVGKINPPTSD